MFCWYLGLFITAFALCCFIFTRICFVLLWHWWLLGQYHHIHINSVIVKLLRAVSSTTRSSDSHAYMFLFSVLPHVSSLRHSYDTFPNNSSCFDLHKAQRIQVTCKRQTRRKCKWWLLVYTDNTQYGKRLGTKRNLLITFYLQTGYQQTFISEHSN